MVRFNIMRCFYNASKAKFSHNQKYLPVLLFIFLNNNSYSSLNILITL